MKLFELFIIENDMYIDQYAYGSWVDVPHSIVHPVDRPYEHEDFIEDKLDWFTKGGFGIEDFGENLFNLVFYNGWVRLVHGEGYLSIEGLHEDIKKIKKLIFDIINTENKKEVTIDVIKPVQPGPNVKRNVAQPDRIKSLTFDFSGEVRTPSRQLMQFLR